jgi:hypothetical protein
MSNLIRQNKSMGSYSIEMIRDRDRLQLFCSGFSNQAKPALTVFAYDAIPLAPIFGVCVAFLE